MDKQKRKENEAKTPSSSLKHTQINQNATLQRLDQLRTWTYSAGAVAQCFIKDIYEMREEKKYEFYWLGRVPCRTVRIVGMVVGIDNFADMTRFKVDDGTAIIDCDCRHPKQPNTFSSQSKDGTKSMSLSKPNSKVATGSAFREIRVPTATQGQSVIVKGNILKSKGTRNVRVEPGDFATCTSVNDELRHWMNVTRLHQENYSVPEPFTIPIVPKETSYNQPDSQTSSFITNNDTSSSSNVHNFTRLRHPSRLKISDLTPIRFRYYLKHYLDFAEPYVPESCEKCLASGVEIVKSHYEEPVDCNEHFLGFTLSYLRRVPVLAEMALAVVNAERSRREQDYRRLEEKQRQGTQPISNSYPISRAIKSSQSQYSSSEPSSAKAKRLFAKTIRDLYKEGSIIIWCGRSRPHAHARHENNKHSFGKISHKNHEDTMTSITSSMSSTWKSERDEEELSEPENGEEAYLSVTPKTIGPLIANAITKLQDRKSLDRKSSEYPSAEEILKYLQASDGRWQNLGVWAVKEALKEISNTGTQGTY